MNGNDSLCWKADMNNPHVKGDRIMNDPVLDSLYNSTTTDYAIK